MNKTSYICESKALITNKINANETIKATVPPIIMSLKTISSEFCILMFIASPHEKVKYAMQNEYLNSPIFSKNQMHQTQVK